MVWFFGCCCCFSSFCVGVKNTQCCCLSMCVLMWAYVCIANLVSSGYIFFFVSSSGYLFWSLTIFILFSFTQMVNAQWEKKQQQQPKTSIKNFSSSSSWSIYNTIVDVKFMMVILFISVPRALFFLCTMKCLYNFFFMIPLRKYFIRKFIHSFIHSISKQFVNRSLELCSCRIKDEKKDRTRNE